MKYSVGSFSKVSRQTRTKMVVTSLTSKIYPKQPNFSGKVVASFPNEQKTKYYIGMTDI